MKILTSAHINKKGGIVDGKRFEKIEKHMKVIPQVGWKFYVDGYELVVKEVVIDYHVGAVRVYLDAVQELSNDFISSARRSRLNEWGFLGRMLYKLIY